MDIVTTLAPGVQTTPQASVKAIGTGIPSAEYCTLGMMTGKDGNSYTRQSVFEALMRQAFGSETELNGYRRL
jgi:hypothetical protein